MLYYNETRRAHAKRSRPALPALPPRESPAYRRGPGARCSIANANLSYTFIGLACPAKCISAITPGDRVGRSAALSLSCAAPNARPTHTLAHVQRMALPRTRATRACACVHACKGEEVHGMYRQFGPKEKRMDLAGTSPRAERHEFNTIFGLFKWWENCKSSTR